MHDTNAGLETQRADDEATTRLLPAVHDAVLLHAPLTLGVLHRQVRDHADYTEPRTSDALAQLLDNDVISLDTNSHLVPTSRTDQL